MARINRTRTRRGSRRVIKKHTQETNREIGEKITKVIMKIISEHKNIIVFLPAYTELKRLPSKITDNKKNLQDFVESHVYAGDIYTVFNWNLSGEKSLILKSLNGTKMELETGEQGMRINGTVIDGAYPVARIGDDGKILQYSLQDNQIKKIKDIADEVIFKHDKEIIIFFPEDDEYFGLLPANFSYDTDNIRNFIYNHIYEGNINTLSYMKRGEKKTLNSLNGTPLNIEKNKKGIMFVNGIKVIHSPESAKIDGINKRVYPIGGVILP